MFHVLIISEGIELFRRHNQDLEELEIETLLHKASAVALFHLSLSNHCVRPNSIDDFLELTGMETLLRIQNINQLSPNIDNLEVDDANKPGTSLAADYPGAAPRLLLLCESANRKRILMIRDRPAHILCESWPTSCGERDRQKYHNGYEGEDIEKPSNVKNDLLGQETQQFRSSKELQKATQQGMKPIQRSPYQGAGSSSSSTSLSNTESSRSRGHTLTTTIPSSIPSAVHDLNTLDKVSKGEIPGLDVADLM